MKHASDRELLELAAKAAGAIWIDETWPEDLPGLMLDFGDGTTSWNPLNDDGDAFRLAVKLRIDVVYTGIHMPQVHALFGVRGQETEIMLDDEFAAVRRAIVRAAAKIGNMKD